MARGDNSRGRRTVVRGRTTGAARGIRSVTSIAASIVQLATVAASAYAGATTVLAWSAVIRGRAHTDLAGSPDTRFVVLVPAHDEARLIGDTVRQLLTTTYPSALFTVHVVADNCTDATASIAAAAGATVHLHSAAGGKGAALDWALARIRASSEFDAVVIVDADTLVDPGALAVLDARLRSGERAVQAHYGVSAPDTSPATALRAAALAVRHYLRPLGKTSVGGSAGLFGNGMVFTDDVLRAHPWSSHLTEDIELQLALLMEGQRVDFAPDAVVRAEMPATLEAATTQNERWERGRIDLLRTHARRLISAPGRGKINRIDAVADLAIPPFSVLAALTVGSTALGLVASRRRCRVLRRGAFAGAAQIFYLVSGLLLTHAPRSVWLALVRAPRFVLWKLALWTRMACGRGTVRWVRTARNELAG